jgi:hypothetical protein
VSSYKVTVKIDSVDAAAEQAFKETVFIVGREFTRVITEPRSWDGFEGQRDIVDKGQLRSSQQVVFTQPLEAIYSWPVEHAASVALGYTLRNGKEVKGRNWTEIALQEFDAQAAFEQRYRANLSKI